jgi:ribosomal protein L37E
MTKRKRQTIQRPKEKDRQYNGQKKSTDNTMVKGKRYRQYNGQKKKTDNTMAKITQV